MEYGVTKVYVWREENIYNINSAWPRLDHLGTDRRATTISSSIVLFCGSWQCKDQGLIIIQKNYLLLYLSKYFRNERGNVKNLNAEKIFTKELKLVILS